MTDQPLGGDMLRMIGDQVTGLGDRIGNVESRMSSLEVSASTMSANSIGNKDRLIELGSKIDKLHECVSSVQSNVAAHSMAVKVLAWIGAAAAGLVAFFFPYIWHK